MPRFSKKEAKIIALAEQMIAGLLVNPILYPNPPHPAMQMGTVIRWKVTKYNNRRQYLITSLATTEQTTTQKDDTLENLIEVMKADLCYAENTVNFDDDKLKLIGWADIVTAILTEATFVDQPQKTENEYCVIAINKSGDGGFVIY